jgi:putative redox protein
MTMEVQVEQVTSKGTARGHSVLIDRPTAKGGEDRGPLGGEVMLVALGGCYMSNLLAAIRAREAKVSDVRITVVGEVGGSPDRVEAFTLKIRAKYDDRDEMQKLITIAERVCIVTNTLKAGARVTNVLEDGE